jgi:hypothetical protein
VDSIFPIFIVVVFVIVIVAFAVLSYRQQQARIAEMSALAAELGWQFDAEADYSHEDDFGQFSIFTRGHSRYAYNTLRGRVEIDGQPCAAKMGDYRYRQTSGSGKSRRTHTYHFSYLVLDLPYRAVPHLAIRREDFLDSIAGALGFDDIDFESAEFSRHFHVKSSDKRFAYDVVHPAMMEFLLTHNGPPLEISERCACISQGAGAWTAEQFRANLDWATDFFKLWPRHLVSTLGTRG